MQVVSPIVVPAPLLKTWDRLPGDDFAQIAHDLDDAVMLEAPPLARRVADADDLRILEAQLIASASATSPA